MKFGFSIAVFLGTMALVIPALSVDSGVRRGIAWTLSLGMIAEMVPIVAQALRGTTSHFTLQGPFNAALWQILLAATTRARPLAMLSSPSSDLFQQRLRTSISPSTRRA
jgi:hypothetical protein